MPRNKTHFDDQQSDLVYGLCDQTTRLEFQVPAPTLTPMTLGEFTSLGLCFLTRQMCCSKWHCCCKYHSRCWLSFKPPWHFFLGAPISSYCNLLCMDFLALSFVQLMSSRQDVPWGELPLNMGNKCSHFLAPVGREGIALTHLFYIPSQRTPMELSPAAHNNNHSWNHYRSTTTSLLGKQTTSSKS